MLFPKVSDSMTSFVAFMWTAKGIAIVDAKTDDQLKTLCTQYDNVETYGEKAFLICAFRCPTAKFTADVYRKLFEDVKCNDKPGRKGLYMLNKSQMLEAYRGWRRCFAQGYHCTEQFNLASGERCYNPMISPSSHFSFDVRLGYLIYVDRRAQLLIGDGPDKFTLKAHRRME